MSDIDNWAKQVDTENMPLNKNNENDKESTFQETTTNKDIACAFKVPCWSCNIPLYIHYTLPVYWIVASLFGLSSISKFIFFLVVNGPVLFGTVFVHELGTKRVVSSLLPKTHSFFMQNRTRCRGIHVERSSISHTTLAFGRSCLHCSSGWSLRGYFHLARRTVDSYSHVSDLDVAQQIGRTDVRDYKMALLRSRQRLF